MQKLLLTFSLLMFIFGANAGTSQIANTGDDFQRIIARAQNAVESESASIDTLDDIRAELDELRQQVSEIVDAGSLEARTIQAQIEALGPPPADGESEPDEIAARRAELNSQLAEANRPIREAQERLNQVELLIRELDGLIRRKDTNKLIQRFPSIF